MATSLGAGCCVAAMTSSPAVEAESNWGTLERALFFPGEMLCSSGAHVFGYSLHLGVCSWLLGTHPTHLTILHLFLRSLW